MKTVIYIETFERQVEVEVTELQYDLLRGVGSIEERGAVISKVQHEATEIAETQRVEPELTGACCVDENDVELFDLPS